MIQPPINFLLFFVPISMYQITHKMIKFLALQFLKSLESLVLFYTKWSMTFLWIFIAVRRRAYKRKSPDDVTLNVEKENAVNEQCACESVQLQWMQEPG